MSASQSSKQSAESLDLVNQIVFTLCILGSIVLIVYGLFPVEDPFCSGYFCDDGLYNIEVSIYGVAVFLVSLLTFRFVSVIANQSRLQIEILEELQKS